MARGEATSDQVGPEFLCEARTSPGGAHRPLTSLPVQHCAADCANAPIMWQHLAPPHHAPGQQKVELALNAPPAGMQHKPSTQDGLSGLVQAVAFSHDLAGGGACARGGTGCVCAG
jgi:hypothetical protein